MEHHPDRALGHRQACGGRGDRQAIEGDRGHDVALTWSQRLQKFARVAQRMRILGLWRGEELLEILDQLDPPSATAAQSVDDLVTRDRIDSGREGLLGVPGVALKVDRQQGLLHCILDVRVPRTRKSGARYRPALTDRCPPAAAGMLPHRPRSRRSSSETNESSGGPWTDWAFIRPSFSFRLPLQIRENILARDADDAGRPM